MEDSSDSYAFLRAAVSCAFINEQLICVINEQSLRCYDGPSRRGHSDAALPSLFSCSELYPVSRETVIPECSPQENPPSQMGFFMQYPPPLTLFESGRGSSSKGKRTDRFICRTHCNSLLGRNPRLNAAVRLEWLLSSQFLGWTGSSFK
ncbi:hypothetical protein CDAR_294671 [Caerostris darwini]|uniref:Uncharacterized protein n=1 Tax=Caerostris darwini TaxID=1538125 RepID=A0AAV4UKS1_9ARAC|nr:hypothetical protein CDAR_294671 [Caerostris darwini]